MSAQDPLSLDVHPGHSIGIFTLGLSLHEICTYLKGEPKLYSKVELHFDTERPVIQPVIVNLPANGLRLRFDGPDQRLRLIEILDFTKSKLVHKGVEFIKPQDAPSSVGLVGAPTGPKFRHIYDKMGPTFDGEYQAPVSKEVSDKGIYIVSYPGLAFRFPVRHSAYSPNINIISLLTSSATSPSASMAVFAGSSWEKARATLFTAPPPNPRSIDLVGRDKGGVPDEVESVRVHGEGRIELVRRSSPSFWILLGETTPQDLLTELGPPDAVFNKIDRRLAIHKQRTESGTSDRSVGLLSSDQGDTTDSDQGGSILYTDDEDSEHGWVDEDEASHVHDRDSSSTECFWNYFHHGFDILISQPTHVSPPSPTSPRCEAPGESIPESEKDEDWVPVNQLAATKIILFGNIPGSYQFNRHRRCRWTMEHVPSGQYQEPLSSEMSFTDISGRLKEVFKDTYANKEEEKSQQRPMAINRGWGESPGSSCELLGGWEEGNKKRDIDNSTNTVDDQGLQINHAEIFGFPGIIFEVLKNNTVSCVTVY